MHKQVETGHEDEVPLAEVLVLNQYWLESRTPEEICGYVEVVVRTFRDHSRDPVEIIAERLREELDALGIHLAEPSYHRTAEQLAGARRLQILKPDGTVLHSDPGIEVASPSHRSPYVSGAEDPESPDRPRFGT